MGLLSAGHDEVAVFSAVFFQIHDQLIEATAVGNVLHFVHIEHIEMLSATLELVSDEPDAVEIDPHGKLLIFFLNLVVPRTLLAECLMVHGESEHNVRTDFSSVQGAIEATKLNGVVAVEEAVQIEEVVAAVVIMGFPHSTVALIPNALNLCEVFGLDGVKAVHQVAVHLFAMVCISLYIIIIC